MDIGENEGQAQATDAEGHAGAGTAPEPGRGGRWPGLPRLLGRRHGHLRLIAVVAAVVVVAGGAGGYVALASSGVPASSPGARAGLDMASPSTTTAAPSASGAGAAGSDLAGTGSVACPMIPAGGAASGGTQAIGSATHVFTRTTTDGVTIRTYRLAATGSCLCGPIPSGASASDARLGGSLSVEVSDDSAVGQGALFDEPPPTATTGNAVSEPTGVVSGAFGVAEGTPAWWTAVTVGPDVSSVEMTFADGSTDQMAPVDGVAVLAHMIDPSVASSGGGPYEVRGTLRLLGPSGAVITSETIPQPAPAPPSWPTTSPGLPPVPRPGSPPATARPTTTTTVPTLVAPTAAGGAAMACPDLVTPQDASAG